MFRPATTIFQDWLIFLLALGVAAVSAGRRGFLVGLPSLRLRGDYLAIVTLGFGQIIVTIIRNMEVVGGASASKVCPNTLTSCGCAAAVIGCIFVCAQYGVVQFRTLNEGRARDEVAAEAAGVNTTRVKVLAFVISAMWAGVAGALQVHYTQLAHPNDFTFMKSIEVVVMVVLGGLGSITGSAMAAVLLRLLEEYLRDVNWAFGSGVALVILAAFLAYPKYGAKLRDTSTRTAAAFRWLSWPIVSLVGLALLYQYGSGWMATNVSALRYVIYALILIVLMLLRPQGLLGRGDFGGTCSADDSSLTDTREEMARTEPAEEETAGTLT
jgi:branched-chain amino acid transport system permease protein